MSEESATPPLVPPAAAASTAAGPPVAGAASSDAALVLARPLRPPRLARSLEEADASSLLMVNRAGEVVTPAALRRNALLVGYGLPVLMGLLLVPLVAVFGWFGLLPLVLWGGAYGMGQARAHEAWTVLALLQADRLDEAAAACRRSLARRRGGPLGRRRARWRRAWMHRCLATIESRRGRHEAALAEIRSALALCPGARDALATMAGYEEVGLLVELGRVGEARARLEARPLPERAGEVLRVRYWLADLYVQFAERHLRLDEDELWQRAQQGLRMSSGAALLALAGWGYTERRDSDMADHLIHEAVERYVPWMRLAAPALWSWVESRRGAKLPSETPGATPEPAPGLDG